MKKKDIEKLLHIESVLRAVYKVFLDTEKILTSDLNSLKTNYHSILSKYCGCFITLNNECKVYNILSLKKDSRELLLTLYNDLKIQERISVLTIRAILKI